MRNRKVVDLSPASLNDWLLEREDEDNAPMLWAAIYVDMKTFNYFYKGEEE